MSCQSARSRAPWVLPSLLMWLCLWGGAAQSATPSATPQSDALATYTVGGGQAHDQYTTDATVEAVRDAGVASQVPGRITALLVRAGDRVQAGQVLARIDPAVVQQQVAGSQAQLAQAQAQAVAARNEYRRAQQLVAKAYISQAALEQAQALARAADAQVQAMQAQVAAQAAQAGLHVLRAPFAGWVAQVGVSLGDVAHPGQALMQVYDPSALRVSAQVPESVASLLAHQGQVELQTNGTALSLPPLKVDVLPAVDPMSRTVTVRVALPSGTTGLQPGQSLKLSLPMQPGAGHAHRPTSARLMVPARAVVLRSELQGVYVVDAHGNARLRQVRLGRPAGELVEVLAGLQSGERVALDPVAAAR